MSGWTAIIPIKPWRLAKSRLDHPRREALARAFSLDTLETVSAARSIERVVVVTAETQLTASARRLGVRLLRDRPLVTVAGLDAAVDIGRRWAVHRCPGDPVVVIPADLPGLRPEHLDDALARLGRHRGAFVPDRHGTGTTLVSAESPWHLRTAYGPGSAQRHEGLGLRPVVGVSVTVRSDVDTLDDLRAASTHGLGPHTAAALSGADVARAHADLQST